MRSAAAVLAGLALLLSGCTRERPSPGRFPLSLLQSPSAGTSPARVGRVSTGGEERAALLESARFAVDVPARPLLTFGIGLAWSGDGEAPGWYQLDVRAVGQLLATRRLNPRAARGWRDVTLELKGLGARTELDFTLRFTDRDGKDVPQPPGLLLAVAEPTVHDLDAYGRAKGVVLISIDTLRRDHVGLYGYKPPTTPRLDVLGAQGLVLDDAVSTSSWTLPAHLSMLTSVDPGVHGGTAMKTAFNRRVPTLAELLRRAGFSTHAITSHLYVSSVYGLDQGFDFLDFHQDRKAADTVARGIDLVDRVGDRPFFLFLHFYDPHWHYDPPADTLALFERGYAGTLTGQLRDFQERTRASLKPGDLEHLQALYDGEIRYTDDQVGVFLDHLARRGLDKGTLVFVTSDHGEEFLEHESWEHQKTLYEEVVRVPMLMRGPGVATRREKQQASVLDVSPTVLSWAGVAVPPGMQGRSLLGPLEERETYGETDHTLDHSHKLFLRAGAGRWKAIFTLAPDAGRVQQEEWYDLASDPGEKRSVPPRAEIADKVRERALGRWRDARGRGGRAPAATLTDRQREELQALGYVSQ